MKTILIMAVELDGSEDWIERTVRRSIQPEEGLRPMNSHGDGVRKLAQFRTNDTEQWSVDHGNGERTYFKNIMETP